MRCVGLLDHAQGVDAAVRLQHRIAARGQGAGAEGAHRLLVFHQQHHAMPGMVGGGLLLLGLRRLDRRLDGDVPGEEDAEGRAAPHLGIAEDEAAGLLDDAIDHGQAEAGALADFLGGEEGVEDLVADIGGNAGAGVLDLDDDVVGGGQLLFVVGGAFGLLRRSSCG